MLMSNPRLVADLCTFHLDLNIHNMMRHCRWILLFQLPCATVVGPGLIFECIWNLHLEHEKKGWMSYTAFCFTLKLLLLKPSPSFYSGSIHLRLRAPLWHSTANAFLGGWEECRIYMKFIYKMSKKFCNFNHF